jgi:hypothetical protein
MDFLKGEGVIRPPPVPRLTLVLDEGIVLNRKNGEAMSARLILGVEKLPRVGLFAH